MMVIKIKKTKVKIINSFNDMMSGLIKEAIDKEIEKEKKTEYNYNINNNNNNNSFSNLIIYFK